MEQIDYSVIIRTTGHAHQKYQSLLNSVLQLEPQPKEVIVVLPDNSELPREQIGCELFYFCKKGMVRQRLFGAEMCKTRYALFCDDDVSFPKDFIVKLHGPIAHGRGSFSVAPLYSFLPDEGMNSIICAIMGSAVPSLLHRNDRYISVLKTTGYSYNRHLNQSEGGYYETQSAPWTCFYADVEAMKCLQLDNEHWLDSHGYAALDDQTMFYKAWLMGYKTMVVPDAQYEHLDGGTSTKGNNPNILFSRSFNRYVFWHRFIYKEQKWALGRIVSRLALGYFIIWNDIRYFYSVVRHRMTLKEWAISRKGLASAKKYIKSEEYKRLAPVIKG